jgi:hypothetical protein
MARHFQRPSAVENGALRESRLAKCELKNSKDGIFQHLPSGVESNLIQDGVWVI